MPRDEKLLFRRVFRWAAHRSITGRAKAEDDFRRGHFTRREVNRLLAVAWRTYDELEPAVPREMSHRRRGVASVRKVGGCYFCAQGAG